MIGLEDPLSRDKKACGLSGVVLGGILGIVSGLMIDYAREFWFRPRVLDKQIEWMLSLDAERIHGLIPLADEFQDQISDLETMIRLKQFTGGIQFLLKLEKTDYYERYEQYHSRIRDDRARTIIRQLERLSSQQTRLAQLLGAVEQSITDVVKSNYNEDVLRIAKYNLDESKKTLVFVKEQSEYLLFIIQNFLVGSGARIIDIPYGFQIPCEYLNYGTSTTARSFQLSIPRKKQLGIDSVWVIFQSTDSITLMTHDSVGWTFHAAIPADSLKF